MILVDFKDFLENWWSTQLRRLGTAGIWYNFSANRFDLCLQESFRTDHLTIENKLGHQDTGHFFVFVLRPVPESISNFLRAHDVDIRDFFRVCELDRNLLTLYRLIFL